MEHCKPIASLLPCELCVKLLRANSRLSGEEKINNKKVKIMNKEVAVTKVKFEYRLSQRQTPNNK